MRRILIGIAAATTLAIPIGRSADAFLSDAVFVNGKVWTVDPTRPEVQAIASGATASSPSVRPTR
jgi:hypothetical protein